MDLNLTNTYSLYIIISLELNDVSTQSTHSNRGENPMEAIILLLANRTLINYQLQLLKIIIFI